MSVQTNDELVEELALALLNDDRQAGGWPPVESRDGIPNSEGYVRNARLVVDIIAAREQAVREEAARVAEERHAEWTEALDAGLTRLAVPIAYAKGAANEAELLAVLLRSTLAPPADKQDRVP